nr:MAG TPA: hypothetical protein [Caudoviricetes sp.]
MLFDNGIKAVKKGNTIVAQNGSRVYDLTVNQIKDTKLNPICRHGEVEVEVHGDAEKKLELAMYTFGPSISDYDLDDIVYKIMQEFDGVGLLYAIDEESTLGKRCTVRMHEDDAITTAVFSLKGAI